ncbi:MAG: histidinol-phosphate transaminase [Sphingomonadaceae bacterium]|uniref:histidinol-phosphate transaminase n=1 Tax=Thermaurantiacus sp. TaxID=2820283 RepID=UPI00298F3C1B|nr:histidinol-phosphate transaminase [Thermaurantiacus sp.]MCS6986645.1 histidinol-phosphate transaminase [Sphingomonadaceae bacterium]MDW8414093.1 histidinol-phosphate transaminase [Thermaurantiacus sp.]
MAANGPQPNPWITAIRAYEPGRARLRQGGEAIKLSANENPWGPSPAVVEVIRAHAHGVHRYPDGSARRLRERLAALHDLEPERIVCGTGSDELLNLVPLIYCRPGDSVVHVRHGFMVYPIAARRAGAEPLAAPDRDYVADVDALLGTVRSDTRVVFLANPNNPTGTMIDRAALAHLHAGLPPHVVLVVDQAYAEYLDDPDPDGALALARWAPNVIVTRTFSKIYGLGGLRVGWATGPAAIMTELDRVRAPFPISTLGLVAAETAVSDQDWVARCRAATRIQRARLEAAIARHAHRGLRAVPSSANFVLVLCPDEGPCSAPALLAGLEDRGILVRHLPSQGLPQALRITVGTEDETSRLIAALDELAA